MPRFRFAHVALAAVSLPAAAMAHPGHGSGEAPWGVLHYLTEPEHLFGAALILLIVGAAVLRRRTAAERRSVRH
jgi:urease accessory protein